MRKYIKKAILKYIHNFDPTFLNNVHPYYAQVNRHDNFDTIYDEGTRITGTKESLWRRDRFYNLYSAIDLVRGLEGKIIELGCYRGLSSYIMCKRLQEQLAPYAGEGYIICDSFQGLSAPTQVDGISKDFTGMFSTDIDIVKKNLAQFNKIEYYAGWIPEVFQKIPKEYQFKFVHVDVDLAHPTIDSLEFFFPKLVKGGVIVCDDYGSKVWPGTKKIVDEFCNREKCRALRVSTGQILIIK